MMIFLSCGKQNNDKKIEIVNQNLCREESDSHSRSEEKKYIMKW